MVPDKETMTLQSALESLNSLFTNLKQITEEKQKYIIDGNWAKLAEIVSTQNEMKKYIENAETKLNSYKHTAQYADNNMQNLRATVKKTLLEYKELETVNVRLLKDALYLAKLKASKVFKIPLDDDTYSPLPAKSGVLGRGSALVMDRLI